MISPKIAGADKPLPTSRANLAESSSDIRPKREHRFSCAEIDLNGCHPNIQNST